MWDAPGKEDRFRYYSQTDKCYIPGYSGYCPQLRFRFGKSYGQNTRQILKEIRSNNFYKPQEVYREQMKYQMKELPTSKDRPHSGPAISERKHFITGYTGFVPGLMDRYGKPYGAAAEDSMRYFKEHQRPIRHSAPQTCPTTRKKYNRPKRSADKENVWKNKIVSPELPPIVGYTGHIPHARELDVSLTKGEASARALKQLREENSIHRSSQIQNDELKIPVLDSSYCNWG